MSKNLKMNTKVPANGGKALAVKINQKPSGKLNDGTTSMAKGEGIGQGVKTVKSNPPSGKASAQPGNTAMGNGGVIDGFV